MMYISGRLIGLAFVFNVRNRSIRIVIWMQTYPTLSISASFSLHLRNLKFLILLILLASRVRRIYKEAPSPL